MYAESAIWHAGNFPAEPRSELPLRRIRRTNWAAMQAYVLIGIFMRRARRTTFGRIGCSLGFAADQVRGQRPGELPPVR
jgi:hypothetical protein